MRLVLAMIGMFSIVGVALAQDTPKPDAPKPLRGKVVSADAAQKSLVVKPMVRRGADALPDVTVTTDDKTKITLDDKAATLADLKADMFVTVTPDKGLATEIKATTKMPTRGGRRGGADAPKPG